MEGGTEGLNSYWHSQHVENKHCVVLRSSEELLMVWKYHAVNMDVHMSFAFPFWLKDLEMLCSSKLTKAALFIKIILFLWKMSALHVILKQSPKQAQILMESVSAIIDTHMQGIMKG